MAIIQNTCFLPLSLNWQGMLQLSRQTLLVQGVCSIQVPIQVTCYDTVKRVFSGHPRGKL